MAGDDSTLPAPNNSFLLDLAQQLGRIEGQNQLILQEQGRAAEGRKAQYEAIEKIRADVSEANGKLGHVADRVSAMEPDVSKMKGFRSQVGALAVFVTAVVTGAVNLLVLGITHMGDIKNVLREFLN